MHKHNHVCGFKLSLTTMKLASYMVGFKSMKEYIEKEETKN